MLGKGAVAGAGGERPAPRRRAGGEYRIAKLNRKAWPEGGGARALCRATPVLLCMH